MVERSIKVGGLYKHYKDKLYRVHTIVKHSETLEDLVMYEALYDNERSKFWVRPLAMFLDDVEVAGVTCPRFALQAEED